LINKCKFHHILGRQSIMPSDHLTVNPKTD